MMLQTISAVSELLKGINLLSVSLRILLSVLCGGVIGAERGRAHQPAGMRTHMLVCLGAAIVMSTGQYMYETFGAGDPSRMGAQVISGIGFLGAGSIIISGKTRVRGLTTAAGLWTAASIGLALGIGFYSAGLIGTFVVYLIMTHFKKVEYRLLTEEVCCGIYLEFSREASIAFITQKLIDHGCEVEEVQMGKRTKKTQQAVIELKGKKGETKESLVKYLEGVDGVLFARHLY